MPRGGARRGAGRKPKPEGEKQEHVVSVNLTAAEYDRLSQAANTASESLGGFVRRLLLRHLGSRRKKR